MKFNINAFKRVTPTDRKTLAPYLYNNPFRCCEFSFNNLVIWGDSYQMKWNIFEDRLILSLGDFFPYMPLGKPFSAEQLKEISDSIISQGGAGSFIHFSQDYISATPELDKYFYVESDEDDNDYLYQTEKLFELSGKKLSKKRNLIRQFEKLFPEYECKKLTKELMRECIEFSDGISNGISSSLDTEKDALANAEKYFNELECEGLVLLVEEKIVAFSFFSPINSDTYCVNFEKSLNEFKGASQMINFKTAKYLIGKCKYINREQDLGLPGLRKAKRSYSPYEMILPLTLKVK
jgi:uncharacterized protein